MFTNPYDTTSNQGAMVEVTARKIAEDWTLNKGNGAVRHLDSNSPNKLFMVIDGNALIPLFEHPMTVQLDSSLAIVGDLRGTVSIDNGGRISVRSMPTFEFNRTRLTLQRNWMAGDVWSGTDSALVPDTSDRSILDYPCVIFSRWLSETLTRRLGLAIDTQLRVQVLAAFHYISMHKHYTGEPVNAMELVGVVRKIQTATRVPPEAISEMIDDLPFHRNIADFIRNIVERTGSPRLEGMDVASLFSFLKGSWSGRNPSEIISTALEYPPLFMTMAYMGLKEPGFKSTNIGTLCKMEARNTAAVSFIETIQRIQG